MPLEPHDNTSTKLPLVGWILLIVVMLAPLPLGSNRQASAAALALAIGVLLLIWTFHQIRKQAFFHKLPKSLIGALVLFATTVGWILFQACTCSPENLHHPAYEMYSSITGLPASGSITPNRGATMFALMCLLSYAGISWLGFQLYRSSDQALLAIKCISTIGALYAFYGLAVFLSGNSMVGFWPKIAYFESLTGTFINRNSAATFFGMVLLCQTALIRRTFGQILSSSLKTRDKFIALVENLFVHQRVNFLMWLSTSTALLLTGSRAGVVSTVGGIIVYCLLRLRERARHRNAIQRLIRPGVVVAGIFIVGALLYGANNSAFEHRFQGTSVSWGDDARLKAYNLSITAIQDAPIIGHGYGTFRYIFPLYKDDVLSDINLWDMAHNTYLELAVELGFPALIALAGAVLLIVLRTVTIYRRSRRWTAALALGIFTLAGIHALVDFSVQIPAIACLIALIAGVGTTSSREARLSIPSITQEF